jgi:hypothetical protein
LEYLALKRRLNLITNFFLEQRKGVANPRIASKWRLNLQPLHKNDAHDLIYLYYSTKPYRKNIMINPEPPH